MQQNYEIIIIGAGAAGCALASTLRKQRYNKSILMLSDELRLPYTRPSLSKGILRKNQEHSDILLHEGEYFRHEDIDLVHEVVIGVNTQNKEITLANNEVVRYEKLIFANGAKINLGLSPIKQEVTPGQFSATDDIQSQVLTLTRLRDADVLQTLVEEEKDWIILGDHYVGLEFANIAQKEANQVTILEPDDILGKKTFGVVGKQIAKTLQQKNVRLIANCNGGNFTLTADQKICFKNADQTITADYLFLALSPVPNTDIARMARLKVTTEGIFVDKYLRTNIKDIYAIGDVANFDSVIFNQQLHFPSWDNARQMGAYLAYSFLGKASGAYQAVPYFYCQIGDLNIRSVGRQRGDVIICEGDVDRDNFAALYLDASGHINGYLTINHSTMMTQVKELIYHQASVTLTGNDTLAVLESPTLQSSGEYK